MLLLCIYRYSQGSFATAIYVDDTVKSHEKLMYDVHAVHVKDHYNSTENLTRILNIFDHEGYSLTSATYAAAMQLVANGGYLDALRIAYEFAPSQAPAKSTADVGGLSDRYDSLCFSMPFC